VIIIVLYRSLRSTMVRYWVNCNNKFWFDGASTRRRKPHW